MKHRNIKGKDRQLKPDSLTLLLLLLPTVPVMLVGLGGWRDVSSRCMRHAHPPFLLYQPSLRMKSGNRCSFASCILLPLRLTAVTSPTCSSFVGFRGPATSHAGSAELPGQTRARRGFKVLCYTGSSPSTRLETGVGINTATFPPINRKEKGVP